MLNKIQMNEKKINPVVSPIKSVAPLTSARGKDNLDSDLKALKKLRSPKYIATLQEIGGLFQELRAERLKLEKESKLKQQGVNSSEYNIQNETDRSEKASTYQESRTDVLTTKEETLEDLLLNISTNRMDQYFETYVEETQTISESIMTTPIINSRIQELEDKIEEKLKELSKENEKINDLISLIYPSDLEEHLIGCGVISRPGRPVYCKEDMSIGVDDPLRAAQLEKGYEVYERYCNDLDFLCLEIYIDAFCVIYKDGIAKVVKD